MTETPAPQAEVPVGATEPDVSYPLGHLPLRQQNLLYCPAIPYWATLWGTPDTARVERTALSLQSRGEKAGPAYDGLTTMYTIGNLVRPAYAFLYPPDPSNWTTLNELPLEEPCQFTLPWTTYEDVYERFQDLVQPFSDSLTSTAAATNSFWPMIANFGLPYNLLILSKVDAARRSDLATAFGDSRTAQDMDALQAAGLLYEVDMTIMALEPATRTHPGTGSSETRYTPGSLTVLKQDPVSKALTPIAIQLSTHDSRRYTYLPTDNAWLYALQAAKTSITVYGIWLGHVYQWHIVTAALQMTMYNHLPAGHRLRPLLEPQSQSLIDFDTALLTALWEVIAPPTPVNGQESLLKLLEQFAATSGPGRPREFFDDDPRTALKQRGLEAADFTVDKPWDAYPLVGCLLEIWSLTERYVNAVVKDLYRDDADVESDAGLGAWMDASRDPLQGNVRGLPPMHRRDDLSAVLTSLLYRVTAHGAASLPPAVNPALSFAANFPPCLQSSDVPEPSTQLSNKELLARLPHTGTLGGMTTFYYTFAYTPPSVSLIPSAGMTADLYFPASQSRCNDALLWYRHRIHTFMDSYTAGWDEALRQIRGRGPTTPSDAMDLYHQWARSIEI
ncbi:MAG: hypothetical protein WCD11_37180 [Solirubrobacteraceae bacterium]